MPSNRGTFQGNLAGTGSRILEMLTSSKAVTASYAVTASRLSVNSVGQSGQPVYFQNGVPTADTKTQNVVNWVTANSGSISGATGSSADTNIQVQELVGKSGSWESASDWVGDNSSSVSNTITKVSNLKGISFATGATRITASYNPTSSSQVIINIPSNPGHIGAASASHNHTFAQITDGTAISASVKRLEVSASSIKNSYVTTASFNNFTQSVANGFLPITGGTLTGNLETKDVFISGNLTVGGTTTTIDAQNLNVKDKLILIASGSTTQAAANGAGIAVSTASAGEGGAARIQYLSSGNKFTSSVAFEAPSFTGSLKGTATNAVSASYASNASSATSASYAKNSDKTISASYASSSTTASYALVAESVKNASGLVVNSASHAAEVNWDNVTGHPTFVSAAFQTGAFSPVTYNPVGSVQTTINIPTTTAHITGLNAITQSVKQIVAKTGSWEGVASTASAAYQSASKALATASVAQREAESASYWKTEASKSAANASTYADEASGSMEDARFYRSQAATNATLSSTYAVQSSASAQLAAASASAAATSATNAANYATRAQQSASNAHTSKTLAAASASAAAASASAAAASANAASSSAATAANWAVSASASANQIQADTTVAANWASSSSRYATNASASAALMYKSVGSSTQPVYMTTDGPTAATAYSAASVKEAVTASRVAISAVNTNANQPLTFASGTTPSNPAVIQYDANLTYNALTNRLNVTHVNATGLTGSLRGNVVGNVTGNLTGTASFATSASRAISAASADNATTASYALIAEAVKDGAGLVVNTASYALQAGTASYNAEAAALRTIITNNSASWATDNDTKVTSAANHYKATNQISGSQGGTNTTYVHAITLDAAGHVTAVSTTNTSSIKAASASYATNADSAKTSTSASYSNYAGNAGQLAGQAASAYALKSYADGAYLPITGGVVTGDLTVQKNFTVAGTTSYLNTTDLIVKDKLILVSSGSTTQANSDGAGIAIQTASATTVANAEKAAARFQYRSSDNKFTASVGIVAPDFTGNLTGTASYTTKAGSADSATVATGLGVAGNTSASVAAAIAAKWTYNENTIKGVKVTSASRADSAASATTATTASYNAAGASALAWITANSTSALTNTDTKVTAVGNHYAPTASTEIAASITGSAGAFATNTEYTVITGIKAKVDAKGHVTDIKYTAQKVKDTTIANTDRYVNTAAFASTGSSGSLGVKMTLTRAGSDTATVTATIPVANATAAGVVTAAQVNSWNGAATNSHTHSNKALLDSLTNAKTGSWDGKWTYNENTIKGVKVTSASRADSAATADSATTATTSSYNKAGAEALAWITANSASATTNTDRYVNTAAFASTGSNGANGVKMTLTRAGSDTAQVTAVIPVASATAAGVVTGAQLKSWTSGSSWVGANSASIATAVTNNHTHSNKAVLDGISAADTASWDGKWTYNEATIKAVKVTSASRADSAASATSATTAATASFITWANVSGKPSSFTPAAHNHNLLVTEGDYRATASTPNDYVNNFRFRGLKNNSTIGLTIGTGSYAYVIGLRGWSDSSGGDSHELAFNNAGIFTRHGATTAWGSWVKIITSDLTGSWATAAANSHTHTNKAVLDGITAAKTASWDTAYGWGNHASAGYVKSSGVTSVTITTASNYVSVDSAAAITTTGTRKIDLTAATKGKIESGSVAFGWGNHANAGYVKSSGVTSIATGTGLAGGPITSTGTMSIAAATLGKIESGSTAFGWGNHANAGYAKSADITSAVSALVTASGSKWSTDNDRYVATASFASTGSNGANGVKMTLTRRGSDTGTVVSTIPVATTSAAGVMTGAQVTNLNSAVASASVAKTAMNWITSNSASTHTHSNKAVLDGITAADTASWDAKQAAISDLATIRTNAASGSVAFGWGNHADAGYVKSSGVTSVTIKATSPIAVSSTAAITGTGERTISVASGYAIPTTTQIANFSSATSSVHTHSNKAVLDGITAAMTASWQTAATNNHTHSNKAVLDGITAAKTASWNAAKPGTVTSVTLTTSSNYVVVDSVAAITTSGTRKIDLTETTKDKIENGSSAFEGNTIPYAESSVHSGTIPLTRGQYKNCGVLTGDVTFTFANDFGDGRSTIYAGRFYWGPGTGYSVTFPEWVSWLDSSVDLEVQGWYEFNILDSIGIMACQTDS